jgi:YVTN family beta-propeller protein
MPTFHTTENYSMNRRFWISLRCGSLLSTAMLVAFAAPAGAQSNASQPQTIPSGQIITPLAPTGAVFSKLNPGLKDFPGYTVGQAVKTVISPDGNTLLVLTSGYNRLNNPQGAQVAADSNEYVFVFDLTHGSLRQTQVLQVPNTFFGIAFAPSGNRFYVSGGVDDNIHVFAKSAGDWAETGPPVQLSHKHGAGVRQGSMVANMAVTADGKILVVADISDNAVSIVDLGNDSKVGELDLRPGLIGTARGDVAGDDTGALSSAERGAVSANQINAQSNVAAGQSPFGVAIKGSATAYVSSERGREVDVINIALPAAPKLIMRIPVQGNPNSILLNAAQTRLFVAADNSDRVSVIDTATNRVIEDIRTTAPSGVLRGPAQLPGAAPNSLVLSPDEKTLYVTNGGMNAIAVISVATGHPHQVVGLIPTGWYPQSISISRDGRTLYDVNSKSDPGPNPLYDGVSVPATAFREHQAANQYILQLEKAGLQAIPVPNPKELAWLTKKVAANDFLDTVPNPQDEQTMAALRQHIKHVIYIIKENRTYDQMLGDLDRGNGDPSLAEFGKVITPNQHRLAEQFVDLDNILCSGEVSGNGWPWSTAARETDFNVKTVPLSYAGRGAAHGDAAADGPEGQKQEGYIWDSALRHDLTIRNYGFEARIPPKTPEVPDPFASRTVVDVPVWPHLVSITDPYFRAFDNAYPDFRRELEWQREFDQYVANGDLPNLEFVRFMHDHEGSFSTAIDGINTPEKETADNDYAVGKLIDRVAHSPYAGSTLIFVIEDDAQNGPDHVNAHRTPAFVVGPYVKQGSVVHERYSTVNFVRTIEDVLGLGHLNLNDAYQRPMTALFDLSQPAWTYTAITPAPIATELAAAQQHQGELGPEFHETQSAVYWARQTRGFDWTVEDRVPAVLFNQILWKGLTGGLPYPAGRDGQDYSRDRAAVLKARSVHFLYEGP